MNKTNLLIILLAVISMKGGIFAQQLLNADEVYPVNPVLEFKLPDLKGKQHSISQWQNKIRIINFWATWCSPCLKEIPEFIKMQNEFADKGIQFIGIAIDDKQSVEEYVKTISINYPMLIAGDEGVSLSRQLGNLYDAVPFTVIVNRYEQIIHRQPGEISRKEILKLISPLLQN